MKCQGLQLVPADTKKGQAEHFAIVVPWESSSMEVRLDEKNPAHVNSHSTVIKYAIKFGFPIASATEDPVFLEQSNITMTSL